jgi:hypothetical protein
MVLTGMHTIIIFCSIVRVSVQSHTSNIKHNGPVTMDPVPTVVLSVSTLLLLEVRGRTVALVQRQSTNSAQE